MERIRCTSRPDTSTGKNHLIICRLLKNAEHFSNSNANFINISRTNSGTMGDVLKVTLTCI